MTWGAAVKHHRQSQPRQHRLAAIGLASLLEGLHQGRHTGTLTIARGQSELVLLFQSGQPFVLRRINDPLLSQVLELVLDVIFWEGATYAFQTNVLPPVFHHPAERGQVRIALPTERLHLLAERREAAWEPIRQVVGGNTTVIDFVSPAARARALGVLGHPQLVDAIDGERTFQEVALRSGEPRVKAGLIVTRLLHAGLLRVVRTGSKVMRIQHRAG